MKVLVIVNPQAGSVSHDERQEQWREIFQSHGIDAEIARVPPEGLSARIKRAAEQGVDAVVAAGGDGTVSAVASHMAGTSLLLGVLPVGTRNHFAKDAGIPLEFAAAVKVIAGGATRVIDVGDVNGRTFLNNSSIGAYPEAVQARTKELVLPKRRKTTAMILGLLRVFHLRPLLRVRITHDERTYTRQTPFVFVGNNEYGNLLRESKRARLDEGTLSLFTARSTGLLCLLRLIRDGMLNRLATSRDFEHQLVKEVKLVPGRRAHEVSVDGDVVRMEGTLHYRIVPGALRVLVPKEPPA